jgi:hypothetical protein
MDIMNLLMSWSIVKIFFEFGHIEQKRKEVRQVMVERKEKGKQIRCQNPIASSGLCLPIRLIQLNDKAEVSGLATELPCP